MGNLMRIRSTTPTFWRSQRVASVSWDARLVLKGLESYVDDNGVGKDDLALIVADIFPRDLSREPRETIERVSEAISDLTDAGLLWRYRDDGTDLLFVSFWESIQRVDKPNKPRFRRPDGTLAYGESQIRESVARVLGDSAPGEGEKGRRGEVISIAQSPSGDDATPNTSPTRFDEFWAAYDKKRGRKAAEQKYSRALRQGMTPDQLIAAASAYVGSLKRQGKHPEFTKDPATWLNGEHWNDEVTSAVAVARDSDTDAWMRMRL